MSTAGKPPAGDGGRGPDGNLSPEERAAFQKRADDIGKRLEAAKDHSVTLPKRSSGRGEVDSSGMGRALRVSTELIGGILVGSAIGYGLDLVFGTTPALFILFFLLGSAAGMLNVIRSSAPKQGDGAGKTAAKDDDEDA